jgi:Galactose oxidase, central domain/Kelch motif
MADSDERIEARVRAAFAWEQARAEVDLRSAPLRPHRGLRPSLRLIRPLAAFGLVGALVLVGAGVSYSLRYAANESPAPTASATPSTLFSASPSLAATPSDRYDDGIPRIFDGQTVLRGQAALDAANASTDESSFLVAFWAGVEFGNPGGVNIRPGDNATYLNGGMFVGDQAGIYSNALGAALRVDTTGVAPGPVIARVHTHDPSMMNCPASYATGCVHEMLGEAVLWHGDAETDPHPTTVAQAAASFGVPAADMNGLPCDQFPGITVLGYPSPDTAGLQGFEGVIAVFPSAAALAAAAPDAAAHGEAEVPPDSGLAGGAFCAGTGTDPLRGPGIFSFKELWFARGNVLVGVQYDASVAPDNDVMVVQMRTKLATLSAAGQTLSPTLRPSPRPSASSGPGTFVTTGPLAFTPSGQGPTTALLADGRVLVLSDGGVIDAELFDPAIDRFTMVAGLLSTRRINETATRLDDGRVLLAGGDDGTKLVAPAELYDPATGKFSPTGSMVSPREFGTATLLPDGRVLFVGGIGKAGYLTSAELYDPATGRFTSAGNALALLGEGSTATLLPDGRVLITGGDGSSPPARVTATAELYDPASGQFSPTGSMTTSRAFHTATLLTDGRVLLLGGQTDSGFISSAELYDPTSGTFRATGSMSGARQNHVAVLLHDGKVLVAGGDFGTGNRLVSAELYDPATGRFSPTGSMTNELVGLAANLLSDGRVLVVGAIVPTSSDVIDGAELYLP